MAEGKEDQWNKWNKRIRDLVIWGLGVGGVVNQLFIREEVDWPALVFIAGILGLPFAFRADELLQKFGGSK